MALAFFLIIIKHLLNGVMILYLIFRIYIQKILYDDVNDIHRIFVMIILIILIILNNMNYLLFIYLFIYHISKKLFFFFFHF